MQWWDESVGGRLSAVIEVPPDVAASEASHRVCWLVLR
jgi:hypothetical protein